MTTDNTLDIPPVGIPMEADPEYVVLRRTEYPNVLDFIDAYYWAQRGNNTKMTDYLAKIDLIKQNYPKPESDYQGNE